MVGITSVKAQEVEGCVWLNDTLPASFATIYCPALGIGTTTDVDGRYLLSELPKGEVVLEYAYLGYTTRRVKLTLPEANHRYAHDERLVEQPIKLDGVFVTPDGQDPVAYIMERVNKQFATNKERLQAYEAQMNLEMDERNVDVLYNMMPSPLRFMMKGMFKMTGYGAIIDLCLNNPTVDVDLTCKQTLAGKKVSNSEPRLTHSNVEVSTKAQKQMYKAMTEPLYSMAYSEDYGLDLKNWKKKKFQLQGTIEENGLDVDVLQSGSYKVYIVEDLWTVLRVELNTEDQMERLECRDMGGGIYLPISYVADFKMPDFIQMDDSMKSLGDSLRLLSDAQFDEMMNEMPMDSIPRMARGYMRKMMKALHEGRSFMPSLALRFNIRYKGVKVSN